MSRPLQCFNCQKFGHQTRTCRSEVQTCRYCAGRHASTQCKDNETRTLKRVNCGQGHSATSRLCPKKLEAESKVKPAHKVSTTKQVNRIPAPIPLKNAWTSLTIQEVGKQPSTHQTTTIGEPMEVSTKPRQSVRNSKPMEVSTKPKHTVRNSKPFQNRKPEPVVSTPQQATSAWTRPFVPSIMEFPVAVSKSVPFRTIGQARPTSRQATSNTPTKRGTNVRCTGNHTNCTHRCNISIKEDFWNTRLLPALKKIMEAAMDAINTLTV